MDDIISQRCVIPRAERRGPGGFYASIRVIFDTSPKYIVFASAINTNHRPHIMIMRRDYHRRFPYQVENSHIRRTIDRRYTSIFRFPQRSRNGRGISKGTIKYICDTLMRFIRPHRGTTVFDKTFQTKTSYSLSL